jgi:ABC-type branched-subunit amino acid transport system permease subunit
VLLALAIPLEPYSGVRLTLVAMTIVVIGGVGSLPGALLGGGLLGMAEVSRRDSHTAGLPFPHVRYTRGSPGADDWYRARRRLPPQEQGRTAMRRVS